jgi:carbon monoxide dehydrogenase subunit G
MGTATDLVMVPQSRHKAAAGRSNARWLFLCAALLSIGSGIQGGPAAEAPVVTVTETNGLFSVSAAFAVTESPQTVIAVLTDYERIPEFMPDMQISKVLRRTATGAIVEQQAVSRFMLFSKRIHLVLDVHESDSGIRFRDQGGKSFVSYDGAWMVSQHDSLTVIDYQLSARPSFDVPAFALKRLLKRDSADLIDRIRAEITARALRGK